MTDPAAPAQETAAYGSPALADCDRDSPGFIGRVSRLVTAAEIVVPRPDTPGLVKLVVLFPPGTPSSRGALERPRPSGLIWHQVLEQGRAPNSMVPELLCATAALAELWVAAEVAPEAIGAGQAGVFSVVEHRFC